MYPPLELIHKRCTLSCSQYNNPQVDVSFTCTTKDVLSNVLGQRILRRLVFWIFVRGNKRYIRRLVLWNLLLKGKGRIKRILRRLFLWILLEREKGDTKKFRWLVLLFFWQREKRMKKNRTSFWSKNFSWKRMDWTKTFRKIKRNESEIFVKNLLWNLLKDWLKEIEKCVRKFCRKHWKMLWNSCHGHIFIISWWLKLKFVTFGNFF